MSDNTSKTLWSGRYEKSAAESLRKLNDSLPFDKRMYSEDIQGSIAWAHALGRAGVLADTEAAQIVVGLVAIKAEFDSGKFIYAAGDEDIHTAVERRLIELIGPVAGKLHTGRSRNDQVATDFRLWLRAQIVPLDESLCALLSAIVDQAEEHVETLMPGYTHVRSAQPISTAHWLMSYGQMLRRDIERIRRDSDSASPLGAGALAGTAYPVDRGQLAHDLGFDHPTANSLDAVSDRDFVVEFLSNAALLMVHLSRFSEDVILYSSPQFGFITLDERYTTGSSLMPQKQNPDVLELARGKTGRVIGHLTGFLTTLKGLPSTYNKDIQEDKEALFDTVDTLGILLPALIGLTETMRFNPGKMLAALDEGMLATDLADYLVGKGVPFREAHGLVGKAVRRGLDTGTPLSKLPLADYQAISDRYDADLYAVFDFMASIKKRGVIGGTAPGAVRMQITQIRNWLQR